MDPLGPDAPVDAHRRGACSTPGPHCAAERQAGHAVRSSGTVPRTRVTSIGRGAVARTKLTAEVSMTQPTSSRPLSVVTGASSGIGLSLATVFVDHGFDVVLTADDDGVTTA